MSGFRTQERPKSLDKTAIPYLHIERQVSSEADIRRLPGRLVVATETGPTADRLLLRPKLLKAVVYEEVLSE